MLVRPFGISMAIQTDKYDKGGIWMVRLFWLICTADSIWTLDPPSGYHRVLVSWQGRVSMFVVKPPSPGLPGQHMSYSPGAICASLARMSPLEVK